MRVCEGVHPCVNFVCTCSDLNEITAPIPHSFRLQNIWPSVCGGLGGSVLLENVKSLGVDV